MEIKYYEPGDEREIISLFSKAFHKSLSFDYWQWRFANNPFLKKPLISLMWEKGILAGHYAVSGIELNIADQTQSFSLSGTTMTCPGFEGKGIFPALAADVYARAVQTHGVSGVMGFPNNKSHYALVKKIQWNDINIIPGFSIDSARIDDVQIINIHKISRFDNHHAEFIKKTIYGLGFSVFVNRSASYLNWRYIDCPVNEYTCLQLMAGDKLAGILITKTFDSFVEAGTKDVDILELVSAPDINILQSMLKGLKKFYNERNVAFRRINIWMPIHDPRHLLCEKLGFMIGAPLTFFCAKAFVTDIDAIYNYRNWYLSLGDSDVF
ncbi:MAG: GNAT family N-acetyltransferase [Sphingobacteriales bacterium]|nr:MAG: GNAT family N-acetyltransferase [Sphingobacteriales bacterium]